MTGRGDRPVAPATPPGAIRRPPATSAGRPPVNGERTREPRRAVQAERFPPDRMIALFLIALVAFNPPLLRVFGAGDTVFGLPLLYLYIMVVWGGVLAVAAWHLERQSTDRRSNVERPGSERTGSERLAGDRGSRK